MWALGNKADSLVTVLDIVLKCGVMVLYAMVSHVTGSDIIITTGERERERERERDPLLFYLYPFLS